MRKRLLLLLTALTAACQNPFDVSSDDGPTRWCPYIECEPDDVVWVVGTVRVDGRPLTGEDTWVDVFRTMSDTSGVSVVTPRVDSLSGGFGFALDAQTVCRSQGPVGSVWVFEDRMASPPTFKVRTVAQPLFPDGPPPGCPFEGARIVDGLASDTAWTTELVVTGL